MLAETLLDLLAQAPFGATYIHPLKLVVIAVLFAAWALFATWVDKDTVAVNTYQMAWNMATVFSSLAATLLMLLLPNFWASIAAFLVINLAVATFYIIHRNGLVVEASRVCTPAHIQRLLSGDKARKQQLLEVKERVKLTGADSRRVAIPESNEERHRYALSQDLLFDALWRRANRVEILPAGPASKVRLMIDGVVTEREPLPRADGESILMFLKQASGLSLEERRKPQKGKLTATIADHRYDLVVRSNGSTAGENLTLRIIGDEKRFKVPDLGFTPKQLEAIQKLMYEQETGLVLLSAPPGAGLTTTAYSFARSHDAFLLNIQTVEYEREIDIENLTQNVYVPAEDKPFSAELLRVTRTDPDVIVIPTLRERDTQTATLACQTAAKQKVYVGLPALDLFDALSRWINLVGDRALLAKSLAAVTHQRLIRKLCPTCKAPYKPDPATLKKINMPPERVLYRPPEPEYDKHGNPVLCQHCQGTGYVGRTGVFATLVVDEELRTALRSSTSAAELRNVVLKKGGLSLQQFAIEKALEGVTSIEEVVRATRPPKEGGAPAAARPAPPAAQPSAAPAAGKAPSPQAASPRQRK